MAELAYICESIEQQIAQTREKATVRHWADYSRHAFVNNLAAIIPQLEHLAELFKEAQVQIDSRSETPKPDVKMHTQEMTQLTTVLKRNREMEETRIAKVKEQGIHALAETVTVPELYADLEQKTFSALLKSSYMVERIRLFDKKHDHTLGAKAAQKNILHLLEQKEKEIEDLRRKYDEARKSTFLGLIEKESATDIENELNEVSRSLESRTALMKKLFEATKENHTKLERQIRELEERINGIEDLEAQITGKTFELVTMLKKERDYSKKVLMEIEHETLQLRNSYSKELLNLQEEKIGLKNTLEEKHSRDISELRNESREKNELIKHLKDMATSKENKILKLEEENEKLRLVRKTHEKHFAVKAHFKKKTKKEN